MIFLTYDICRYYAHMKWAEGAVETEDSLLPYPRKVNSKLSVTDTSSLTVPVAARAGISELLPSETLSDVPEQFIPEQYTESREDTWETCDPNETEAFWGCSRTKTSCAVEEKMRTEVSLTSNIAEQFTKSQADMWATCNLKDSEAFWGHSGAKVSSAVEERMCSDVMGSTTDAIAAESVTFAPVACNTEPQAPAKYVANISGNIGHIISISTQDNVSDKNDLSVLATKPDLVAVSNKVEDVEKQMDLPTQNVVTDNIFVAATNTVSQANILSTNEGICSGHVDPDISVFDTVSHSQRTGSNAENDLSTQNTVTDNVFVATDILPSAESISCGHVDCYMPDTVSHSQRLGCRAENNGTNIEMAVTSDDDNDSDSDNGSAAADTLVVDDTEDSDVDVNSVITSRPSPWQTVMTKDPYPVKEQLLLSLEEVT